MNLYIKDLKLCGSTGGALTEAQRPVFRYGETFPCEVTLVGGTISAGTYCIGIDNDMDFAFPDSGQVPQIMAYAEGTASEGGVSFSVNCRTEKFATVINGSGFKPAFVQIKKITSTNPETILIDRVLAGGVVYDEGNATPVSPISQVVLEAMTATLVASTAALNAGTAAASSALEASASATQAGNSATAAYGYSVSASTASATATAAATTASAAALSASTSAAQAEEYAEEAQEAAQMVPQPSAITDEGKVVTVSGTTYTLVTPRYLPEGGGSEGQMLQWYMGGPNWQTVSVLPTPAISGNGSILFNNIGFWQESSYHIPTPSASDNGKVLTVVNGDYSLGELDISDRIQKAATPPTTTTANDVYYKTSDGKFYQYTALATPELIVSGLTDSYASYNGTYAYIADGTFTRASDSASIINQGIFAGWQISSTDLWQLDSMEGGTVSAPAAEGWHIGNPYGTLVGANALNVGEWTEMKSGITEIQMNGATYTGATAALGSYLKEAVIAGTTSSLVSDGTATIPWAQSGNDRPVAAGVISFAVNMGFTVTQHWAGLPVVYLTPAGNSNINRRVPYMGLRIDELDYAVRSVSPLITVIPSATSAYALADATATTNNHSYIYTHAPSTAPTYTLPSVTDSTVTHECVLYIDMTTTASIAFQDADGNAITPKCATTPAVGEKWAFLCRWEFGAWQIYGVRVEEA